MSTSQYNSPLDVVERAHSVPQAMLAQTYTGRLASSLVFSQPKLDGIRCLANAHGLWSRHGTRITSCQHLEATLRPVFYKHPGLVLDGELYAHAAPEGLSTIISLVNTRQPSPEKQRQCNALMAFHVFDVPSHPGLFTTRHAALLATLEPCLGSGRGIHVVQTEAVSSTAKLDQLYAKYLACGYEGQMIRLDAPYAPRRSSYLLKRKPLSDAEFDVVQIHEVQGAVTGFAKRVTLRASDGRTFGANLKCSREYARTLLARSFQAATVSFNGLTSTGLPRAPVVTALHEFPRL